MDRWEYLVGSPYTVRHTIAGFFLDDTVDFIVEVGAYKHRVPTPANIASVALDPHGVTPDTVESSLAKWWYDNRGQVPQRFAVVALGFALEGNKNEWIAMTEMCRESSLLILEWAKGYEHQFGHPSTLVGNKTNLFHAEFTLPMMNTPGYPCYPSRVMSVSAA